ncbi:MAG: immunoglobulin domain-containing protein, partial [Candidatus Omnitrophica bacterium]|nr:immunoglobulin domain-containing protein [Candidatus Omnitrophota bacterium]
MDPKNFCRVIFLAGFLTLLLSFSCAGNADAATTPVILGQPSDVTVFSGEQASFAVFAQGAGTLTYQWYRNNQRISGATAHFYTITKTVSLNAGNYYCVVSNSYGQVSSRTAVLTVKNAPPVIVTQPSAATVLLGRSATLQVVASGEGVLTYQWYKDYIAISGATNPTYFISTTAFRDGGQYYCKVTNSSGQSTSSNTVYLLVTGIILISSPSDAYAVEGQNVSFTVVVDGIAPLKYQWMKSRADGYWDNIPGATSSTYTIINVTEADEKWYDCVITNTTTSVTCSAAKLNVGVPPTIINQSSDMTLTVGQKATFSILSVRGTSPFRYQWQRKDASGAWSNIAGATSASYTIENAVINDTANYRCIVTNDYGFTIAEVITLTVLAPDVTPPTGSIFINNNAAATNNPVVTLTLSATDNTGGTGMGAGAQMQLCNAGTAWQLYEYVATKTWTLNAGDGTKTVYAKFRDVAGNWSATVSANIVLDTTPPVIVITSPQDNAVVSAKDLTVSYTVDGVARTKAFTLRDGLNTLVVTDSDAAGNSASASIKVTFPPVPAYIKETRITDDANNSSPAIYGDAIVYLKYYSAIDGYSVHARNLVSENDTAISACSDIKTPPSIDKDKVVWASRSGSYGGRLAGYDLTTGTLSGSTAPSSATYSDWNPIIGDGMEVWTNTVTGTDGSGHNYAVSSLCWTGMGNVFKGMNAGAGSFAVYGNTVVIKEGHSINVYTLPMCNFSTCVVAGSTEDLFGDVVIHKNKVVWIQNNAVYMCDLENMQTTQVSSEFAYIFTACQPAIYEDKIVWLDERDIMNGGDNYSIYLYDITLGREIKVADVVEPYTICTPYLDRIVWSRNKLSIYENRIVWADDRTGGSKYGKHLDIYMAEVFLTPEITEATVTGSTVDIKGKNFGCAQGDSKAEFTDGTALTVGTWSNTAITCNIPSGSHPNKIRVVTLGGTSNEFTVNLPAPVAPDPPSALTANPTSSSVINLTWNDNSTNEEGFNIYKSPGNSSPFSLLATVGPNVATYNHTGLAPNTVCHYKVSAYNAAGESSLSNEAAAATPGNVMVLSATAISATRIDLSWTCNSNEVGAFIIYRINAAGQSTSLGSQAPTARTFSDTNNLAAGTTYSYEIYIFTLTCIWVGPSNRASATTLQAPTDTTPPTGTIRINDGAAITNNGSVRLTLSATDAGSGMGAGSQMKFSSEGTYWSTEEAYGTAKSWGLLAGDGTRTVYVKFKDVAGNWSNAISASIIVDTTAPVIAITSPADNSVVKTPNLTVNYTLDGVAKTKAFTLT